MRRLNGEVVVLIGSTGGIGAAILEEIKDENVALALASHRPEELEEQAREEKERGRSVFARSLDGTDEDAIREFLSAAREELGRLDVLINLAGLSSPGKVQDLDVDEFDKMMALNVRTTFVATKHFLNLVDPEAGGQILNLSSVASKRANGVAPLYCASKAAMSMLSKATQINAKELNVRVTNVCPGAVDSPFWGDRQVPRETFLRTKDVAEVVHFILTRESHVVIEDVEFESAGRL
jgi:NADP-dependent 3-hydroxy acid dehydrogenase YdfG